MTLKINTNILVKFILGTEYRPALLPEKCYNYYNY